MNMQNPHAVDIPWQLLAALRLWIGENILTGENMQGSAKKSVVLYTENTLAGESMKGTVRGYDLLWTYSQEKVYMDLEREQYTENISTWESI